MKVLWLASWYPNRTAPYNGDFIERHAIATAPFTDQLFVVAVVKDDTMEAGATEVIKKRSGNLVVYTVYYGLNKIAVAEKVLSFRRYFLLQKEIYAQIQKEFGLPDIVHVHVPMNAGLFAKYLKRNYRIPYVVTEHWAGYTAACSPNIFQMNFLFKWLRKLVVKNASALLPVSDDLGEAMSRTLVEKLYTVIPNVVDTSYFSYQPDSPKLFRFIHVSNMGYQKNPEGIITACKLIKERGMKFQMLMIGHKDPALESMASGLGLTNEEISFSGTVPYKEIASQMKRSSALVLFSRFENLPCVLLEALCSGLPVLSSNVGGIAEVVNNSNGILVQSGSIGQLADGMERIIRNYQGYDREKIAANAQSLFNYATVGKQYYDVYAKVLKS